MKSTVSDHRKQQNQELAVDEEDLDSRREKFGFFALSHTAIWHLLR